MATLAAYPVMMHQSRQRLGLRELPRSVADWRHGSRLSASRKRRRLCAQGWSLRSDVRGVRSASVGPSWLTSGGHAR